MAPRKKAKTSGASRQIPSPPDTLKDAPSDGEHGLARRVRGKRGGLLEDLPNMSLDILLEVFGYLHPKDLVNLSRATRGFRSFFMSRANAGLWRAARKNVPGLPDCPPFLSEPAYANVLFFPHCHVCLKNAQHARRIAIEFGARYCKTCEQEMLVEPKADPDLVAFLAEIEALTGKREQGERQEEEEEDEDGRRYNISLPLLSTCPPERLLRSHVAEFRARWEANPSNEARMELLEEEAAKIKEVDTWVSTFHEWANNKESARHRELSQMKDDRITAILDRLSEEGWKEEVGLARMADLQHLLGREKFANKSVALTNSAWQKIRGEANEWMKTIRDKRLYHARLVVLRPRFIVFEKFLKQWTRKYWPSEDGQDEPLHPVGILLKDWLLMPAVQALIEGLDDKEELTEKAVSDALGTQFVDLLYKWYRERKAELVDLLARALDLTGLPVNDPDKLLELAVHSFDCTFCEERFMAYPDVLAHRCRRFGTRPARPDYGTIVAHCGPKESWSPTNVFVNRRVFPDKARALIRTMGLDPDSATHAEMSMCQTRLTCSDCKPRKPEQYEVFDWERALWHQDYGRHMDDSGACGWVVLPEEVAEQVRKFEANAQLDSKGEFRQRLNFYHCEMPRCRESFNMNERRFFAHLEQAHGISKEDAQEDVHYGRAVLDRSVTTPFNIYFSHRRSGKIVANIVILRTF